MTAPSTPTPDTNKLPNDNANNANGIRANHLGPREQEDLDQPIRQGTRFLFSNKFAKAKSLFQQKADTEPLYAFGLASMQFLKAMMLLTQAYTVADTQAELSEDKFDDTFSQQIQSLVVGSSKAFKSNGVMRAHTIKAESCLLMGLLQLCQENVAGYLKAGLNLRKACSSYTLVWEEYQRIGDPLAWLDKNTVSGIQFGVGSMHLLLTLLPDKILHQFAGLPWKVDKDLGMDLLKQSMAGQGTRAAFSALMLLSYFSILSSLVPSIYGQESIQPTIDCLVAAQQSYPKSCFFLYYAARISRVARNVSLSTQSFGMASASVRKAAWAEVAMKHTVAYEVGLNHALQLDWDTSAAYFEQLGRARDWSPAFCQYFVGACHEMSGQRQEAIEVFDDVPVLVHHQHHRRSCLDNFVLLRVEQHQQADYQDLDHRLPGLELLLVLNAFSFMEETYLDRCVTMIHETSQLINTAVLLLLDNTSAHHHELLEPEAQSVVTRYATLRLLNAAVHNALGKYTQAQLDIQWLTAHQAYLRQEDWLIPFIYWEAGVAHWGLDDHRKSREWWQQALSCANYDFEYRMASRVHLAFDKCDALGIHLDAPRHARKRTQA
ncbi:hypothetical protein BC940DRAFT_247188 [Gongronella butleri]|nr:hypothetical protein BC940DRAFT_247188 [Gongronella butleri]